jgi:hypothetical protein
MEEAGLKWLDASFVLFTLAGIGAGAASLALTRAMAGSSLVREQRAWAIYLVIAALIYIGFGLFNGASATWMMVESSGVLLYGGVALVGVLRAPRLIALGWLAHSLWDLLVHPNGHPGFVPWWYPPVCLGFDVVVGAWLLKRFAPAE